MRLVHQLLAALLGTLLLVVAVVATLLYVSVERGFTRYVRALEEARLEQPILRLQQLYASERSWDALVRDRRRWKRILRREPGPEEAPPRPNAEVQSEPGPEQSGPRAGGSDPPGPRRPDAGAPVAASGCRHAHPKGSDRRLLSQAIR